MPIFGDNTVGGTYSLPSSPDRAWVDRFPLSEAGLVSKLTIRVGTVDSNGCLAKALILADSGGAPGSLLAIGSAVAITTGMAVSWVDLPFPSNVSLTSGNYWLGVVTDSWQPVFVGELTSGVTNTHLANFTFPFGSVAGFAWPGSDATYESQLNVYATYELAALFGVIDESSSSRTDYIKATAVDAVCVMDGAPALEEPPAGTNLLIEYDTKLQGDSALQVELLEGSTVIKTASLPNGLGSFAVTPAEWGAVASWPWTPRIRLTSKPGEPPPAEAPEYVTSALQAQKEGEGTTNFAATLASDATAGRTLLSFVALRTSIFTGPVTGNNGNTHTLQDSQAFPSPYTTYSVRSYRAYGVSGGSAHSVSGSKSAGATEEVTTALIALDGGSIVDSATSTVAANGAGATLTSPTVTTTGPALLVAIACGTGGVDVTAPTQTWPGNWTVHQSVAYSSAQAPNGHISMYLATRTVTSAGDYSVDVQVTINEGLLFMIYAVQT